MVETLLFLESMNYFLLFRKFLELDNCINVL